VANYRIAVIIRRQNEAPFDYTEFRTDAFENHGDLEDLIFDEIPNYIDQIINENSEE
jgi:hypothetical protein